MNISVKKTVAILLAVAMCVVYFAACGVKDGGNDSSVNGSAEASNNEASVNGTSTEEGSSAVQSGGEAAGSNDDGSEQSGREENSSHENVSSEGADSNSSSMPDDSEESNMNDNSSATAPDSSDSTNDDSSALPEDDSSVAPPPEEDDSSVAPPPEEDDSSVAPPPEEDDSSVAPPPEEDDSSVAPPPEEDDSSVAPPPEEDDSSVAPPPEEDDSSVAPPPEEDDSSVAPPPEEDDSSVAPPPEEDDSSEVPPPEEDDSSYVPSSPSDPLTPIPEALYADPIDSHFNNSLFLGYSIMMHFGKYVSQWRTSVDSTIMGNSINVGAVGISFWKNNQETPSMSGNSLPRYRGRAYNFEDLPAATGCTTMYIGLTCYSEMKVYGDPLSAANEVIAGVQKIKAKNPNLTIVLLAGTYNTGTFEQLGSKYASRLSNANVRKFNNYVLNYCNANGVDFVDVATPLTNGYGYMPIEYSSDNDYHIAQDAFLIWIDVLRDYARKKEAGTWRNYTVMPTLGM